MIPSIEEKKRYRRERIKERIMLVIIITVSFSISICAIGLIIYGIYRFFGGEVLL